MNDPRFSPEQLFDQLTDHKESLAEAMDNLDHILSELDQQTTPFPAPSIED